MLTIFCVYQTEELYPRFVRAAAEPDHAWSTILARALDGEKDDISIWCQQQLKVGHEVAKYDLQTGVEEDQVAFFIEYWETQFAEYVAAGREEASEDVRSAVDRVIAALHGNVGGEI